MNADPVRRLADRLGAAHILLWTSFVLMLVGLLGDTGQMWIVLMESTTYALGIGLIGDSGNVGRFALGLHSWGLFCVGTLLFLWHRGDDLLRRAMKPAAIGLLFVAPFGAVLGALIWWLASRPEFDEAIEQVPSIAGNRRAGLVVGWLVTSVATMFISVNFSFILEAGMLGVIGAILLAIPQTASLAYWLRSRDPKDALLESAMPPLPDFNP